MTRQNKNYTAMLKYKTEQNHKQRKRISMDLTQMKNKKMMTVDGLHNFWPLTSAESCDFI